MLKNATNKNSPIYDPQPEIRNPKRGSATLDSRDRAFRKGTGGFAYTLQWLYRITRWILGAIFIYAGFIKLLEPGTFAVLIDAFGIVPESMLLPLAVLIPVLEIAAGIGIALDIRGSLAIYAGLLGIFIAILGYAIWMGFDIDCGCFGPEDPESRAFHGLKWSLYRDLMMLAGVGFVYAWRKHRAIEPVRIKILSFR